MVLHQQHRYWKLIKLSDYEALHRLDYTLGSRRWKKSSTNIFDSNNLNLGVKMTARMRAFRIYPILPHLKPF